MTVTMRFDRFDPNDPRLVAGTPEESRLFRREWEAARAAHAIISTKEEIPRSQLVFSKYWIEDEQGNFWKVFGGDPDYAYTVRFFYFNPDGDPVMLEPADPPTAPSSSTGPQGTAAHRDGRRREAAPRTDEGGRGPVSLSEHRYVARIAPVSLTAMDAIHDGAIIPDDRGERVMESFASGGRSRCSRRVSRASQPGTTPRCSQTEATWESSHSSFSV